LGDNKESLRANQTSAWANAEALFDHPRNEYEIKFSKNRNPRYAKAKRPQNFHSFTIYEMANDKYIGKGVCGSVKIIQNKKVKILH
jgi:hypothetical protein